MRAAAVARVQFEEAMAAYPHSSPEERLRYCGQVADYRLREALAAYEQAPNSERAAAAKSWLELSQRFAAQEVALGLVDRRITEEELDREIARLMAETARPALAAGPVVDAEVLE